MIKNNPSPKSEKIEDLRGAIEHRATWFYFMLEEAKKRGLDEEFARAAIRGCGCFHGSEKYPETEDIKEFAEAFANQNVVDIFEMDVQTSDEELAIDFHYCPLVTAWQKLTGNEDDIALMCDIAMDGDRGIIDTYDKFEFELGKTIAKGDDICEVRIRKRG